METIDFGCQVRCLNRQRLIPGSSHPQLNQCASQFLAKVRKEVTTCDSSGATSQLPEVGWMKLKLSERGLRIVPAVSSSSLSSSSSSSSCASSTTSSSSACASFSAMQSQQNGKSDEGFESDSDTSIRPHNNSGGCSSGVNSSSSDMEESDEGRGGGAKKKTTVDAGDSCDSDLAEQTTAVLLPSIRCPLSDILSCQHPAALGRHVVLLTLRSADDSALDILALECSGEESARILTLLCQKIQASAATRALPPPSCAATADDAAKTGGQRKVSQASAGGDGPAPKAAAVSIQSWSDREERRTLDAILVDSKHSTPSAAGGAKAQNIIRKLERQHSEWSLIQRRTRDGLTHLQVSKQKSTASVVAVGGDVAAAAIRGHCNGSVPTATSGAMLNNSNSNNSNSSSSSSSKKKGMPCGDQMARLDTALAITNSNQGHGSRIINSGGVDGVAAGLKRSDTSVAMHQKLSKSKSSGSSISTCSSPPSCILSLQTPELPLSPSVTALSPAVVTDASTSPSPPPPPLPQSLPPAKTSRWSFGAPFRQQQQQQRHLSPEASRRNAKPNQRGRSSERQSCKFDACSTLSAPQSSASQLDGLFVSSTGMLSIKSNSNNNNNNNNNKKSKSKFSKSLTELLPVQSTATEAPKSKRDPSKTRSFLMKLTSSSRKSPTRPTSAALPPPPLSTLSLNSERSASEKEHRGGQQHPLKLQSRGRSLIRLRSSTRLQSPTPLPPPPPPSTTTTTTTSPHSGQTFLIPTKSGQELTRNIYPKEGPAASQQPMHQPVFHLLTGHNNKNASGLGRLRYNAGPPVSAVSNGWAGYCWNDAPPGASLVRHSVPTYATSIDPNNNQHLQQQHQQQQQQQQQQHQQWIYFHPHRHHLAMAAPPQLQPPPTLMKAGDFNKLRLQRSRSQSPGRMRSSQRWLPPAAAAGPSSIGHYYAVPTPIHHQQQPVSLPPDMGLVLSQQHRTAPPCNSPSNSSGNHQELSSSAARSFRRSKSTHTRMSSRSHLTPLSSSKSTNHHHNNNNNNNNNKAVTFHAFATVQLVD